MTRLEVDNWLSLLKSDEIKWARGSFVRPTGYCVLGVLCLSLGFEPKAFEAETHRFLATKLPVSIQATLANLSDTATDFKPAIEWIEANYGLLCGFEGLPNETSL